MKNRLLEFPDEADDTEINDETRAWFNKGIKVYQSKHLPKGKAFLVNERVLEEKFSVKHLKITMVRTLCPMHIVRHWWDEREETAVLDWDNPCGECMHSMVMRPMVSYGLQFHDVDLPGLMVGI